jgi:hypothetical protein
MNSYLRQVGMVQSHRWKAELVSHMHMTMQPVPLRSPFSFVIGLHAKNIDLRRLGSLTEYNITLTAASSFFQAAESLSLLARTCKSVLLLTC